MRILFLTHAFNSLTQRLFIELSASGHQVSVEFDINDAVTREAVALLRPHLILAPYLRRAIPESIWREHVCLIVHPGVVGDRGPSALDWAILDDVPDWGVTLLQAEADMDAGPVWAAETFAMRPAMKSSLYRNEVTEAAVRAVFTAIERLPDYLAGRWQPQAQTVKPMHPVMRQSERAIDWLNDDTLRVLAKIRCSDGFRRGRGAGDSRWRGMAGPRQTHRQWNQVAGHAGLSGSSGVARTGRQQPGHHLS